MEVKHVKRVSYAAVCRLADPLSMHSFGVSPDAIASVTVLQERDRR